MTLFYLYILYRKTQKLYSYENSGASHNKEVR